VDRHTLEGVRVWQAGEIKRAVCVGSRCREQKSNTHTLQPPTHLAV
jgi:hypothetical protein